MKENGVTVYLTESDKNALYAFCELVHESGSNVVRRALRRLIDDEAENLGESWRSLSTQSRPPLSGHVGRPEKIKKSS